MKYKSFIIVLLSYFILYGCGKKTEPDQQTIIPVQTSPVKYKSVAFPIHSSGILSCKREARLAFKTGGIIQKIKVDEGQSVKKGQLLAELDLSEINARFIQAKTALDKAQRDFDRVKNLYNDQVATLEQFQDVESGLVVAKSNLKIAQFNLDHSTITAPEDGKILKRFMEPNEMVSAGTPVLYFGTTKDDWIVRVGLADKDIIKVNLNDSVSISFDAYPDNVFSGTVSEIAEAADPMSGTFEAEIKIEKTNKKLVSGFIAKVMIYPQKSQNLKTVPIESLVDAQNNEGYLWIPVDNHAEKRRITLGDKIENDIIVTNGLYNITHVITSGAQYLNERSTIKVINNP